MQLHPGIIAGASVTGVPSLPTCVLTSPTTVSANTPFTLSWSTTNSPTTGSVRLGTATVVANPTLPTGSATITAPATAGTTTYTMSVSHSGGTSTCSVAVSVTPASTSTPILGPEIVAGAVQPGNQYQSDLRVDSNNASRISITFKNSTNESATAIVSTKDGGTTWVATPQPASGDCDVVYDVTGNVHWMFIDKISARDIGYRKSTDGGTTWSTKAILGASIDHPHITTDKSNSAYRGSVYIAGRTVAGSSVQVLRSRDAGATWSKAILPYSNAGLGQGFVYGMTVLADGTLLIPMTTKNNIIINGVTYGGATRDIYVLRSTDGGVTFTTHFVTPKNSTASAGPGDFFGLGNLAVGKYGGVERVFLTYTQRYSYPTPAKLMLVTSDNGGVAWSTPRSIAPDTPPGWGAASMSPMVNSANILGIQYYSEPTFSKFDLYFIYSRDGGATFSAPLRVSSATSTMPNDINQSRVPGQDQVYGDVGPDGKFYTVWTDSRSGGLNYTIYMRTIQVP